MRGRYGTVLAQTRHTDDRLRGLVPDRRAVGGRVASVIARSAVAGARRTRPRCSIPGLASNARGWFSRWLIILCTAIGAFALINSGSTQSGNLTSFGFLGIYAVQIGLLLSTPIYNRTRRTDDGNQAPISRLWVTPPGWMLAAGAVVGLIVTLLCLGSESFEAVPGCTSTANGPVASAASCTTLAEGYPVHFLGTAPFLSLDPGKTVKVADISVFADPVIYKRAFALDFTTWAVVSFLAYMLWLPSRRTDTLSAPSRGALHRP
jgi:hypothetical protein